MLSALRQWLPRASAEAGLMAEESASAANGLNPLTPRPPHFAAKAKSVIFLFMDGGPSQIDTFDPKPRLTRDNGQALPFKPPTTVFNISDKILGSPYKFQKYGKSGGRRRERAVSACGHLRRRHGHHPLDGGRSFRAHRR